MTPKSRRAPSPLRKRRRRRTAGKPATVQTRSAPRRGLGTRAGRARTPKMPFSLILDPGELSVLRKMARRENTSVASVIRSALHTVIFKSHPDLARHAIESDVDAFLETVGRKLPSGVAKGSRRKRLRNQLVSGLLGGRRARRT